MWPFKKKIKLNIPEVSVEIVHDLNLSYRKGTDAEKVRVVKKIREMFPELGRNVFSLNTDDIERPYFLITKR